MQVRILRQRNSHFMPPSPALFGEEQTLGPLIVRSGSARWVFDPSILAILRCVEQKL